MGVKSLWTLLTPVGRPVQLETVEGKVMAIDSSIWIYQFQATMRDNDGKPLTNAHVLGFLRRIAKLLFYGIKPVFVFDGGAPDLKRSTLNERRKKKDGAASSHLALAQKLLAAQMRREAVLHAKKSKSSKAASSSSNAPTRIESLDDNTVYLEDVESSIPKTPKKSPSQNKPRTPPSSTQNPRYYDHDPYKLPEVNLEEKIAKMTTSAAPDARLATEEEMQSFIDQMKPEDFDVNSPAFRELPTEVQYEIIGDLRLKSRQTSYARLQNMLKTSKTALDFSKQQIMNLRQRNHLTQQLLMTTDSIGKAHISIPVRIASERNREYVLMKNEGESGGWILGIRDQSGTAQKPIEIDQDNDKEVIDLNEESDDDDMEEVVVPEPAPYDPDLREYQREMALTAIKSRQAPKSRPPKPIIRKGKGKANEIFRDLDDDEVPTYQVPEQYHDDEDALAFAIQESMDHAKATSQRKVSASSMSGQAESSKSKSNPETPAKSNKIFHGEDYFTPSRLETQLSFANTGHSRTPVRPGQGGSSLPRKASASIHHVDSEGKEIEVMVDKPASSVAKESTDKTPSKVLFGKPTSLLAAPEILSTPGRNAKEEKPKATTRTSDTSPKNITADLHFGKPDLFTAFDTKETSTSMQTNTKKQLEITDDVSTAISPGKTTSGLSFGKPNTLLGESVASDSFSAFDIKETSTSAHENVDKQLEITPNVSTTTSPGKASGSLTFGKPNTLLGESAASDSFSAFDIKGTSTRVLTDTEKEPEIMTSDSGKAPSSLTFGKPSTLLGESSATQNTSTNSVNVLSLKPSPSLESVDTPRSPVAEPEVTILESSDDEMEEVVPSVSHDPATSTMGSSDDEMEVVPIEAPIPQSSQKHAVSSSNDTSLHILEEPEESSSGIAWAPSPPPQNDTPGYIVPSRSLSPIGAILEDDHPDQHHKEDWDAALEMDPQAEEGEFAKFMSQVKGKDLDDVRREIDDEIKVLNEQRKAAMRDSEDVTQQMVSQIMIMLRYFGIPYITAPMEAEAQCAELVLIGLVDGVITDDSDVFLFGAARVYKNMFNQSKTVECFLLSDLERELGLDRDTLIRLAYLLGSDYVEGLSGVGPVMAMELLKEFPGEDGLHKFKEWWTKVQSGKDKEEDNKSKFRKQFKRKFKDLYLPEEWPNPVVREAYYHPLVDSSDEPFKWGLPDLDGLREYLRDELSWSKSKVDELLLPIIQRMNRRGQEKAANKQSNLNEFLDLGAGSATLAPKKRHTFTSKRLQNVISDFRKQKRSAKAGSKGPEASDGSESDSVVEAEPPKKKRKQAASGGTRGKGRARGSGSKTERGGKRASATRKGKSKAKTVNNDGSESGDAFSGGEGIEVEVPLKVELRPRPKPRPVTKSKPTESTSDLELVEL